jgi:hypothetical protein
LFVGGVVVHDQVQLHSRVDLRHVLEEAEELVAAMPRVTGVGDLAGGYLQRGEQRRCAMSDLAVNGIPHIP